QAEDGIRDRNVTGVQTCALPILARRGGPPRIVQVVAPGSQRVMVFGVAGSRVGAGCSAAAPSGGWVPGGSRPGGVRPGGWVPDDPLAGDGLGEDPLGGRVSGVGSAGGGFPVAVAAVDGVPVRGSPAGAGWGADSAGS